MGKRTWSIALIAALIAGVFTALPAGAAGEPGSTGGVVPAAPNIVDPSGDANGHSSVSGIGGGLNLTGADILAVWFTNDAENLYTHIQTSTGVRAESQTFITYVGPTAGTDCMQLRMTTEGEGVTSFSSLNLSGTCGAGTTAFELPLLEEVGPEDTSILTGTFPLAEIEKVATAKLLAEPDTLIGFNARQASARVGIIDDTAVGTDYTIGSGGGGTVAPEPKPKPEPPGKNDPPGKGKKKGCGKGKGKQKGACPGQTPEPPSDKCPAFVPGEAGAEAETSVVTDAATEEAPVVVETQAEMGGPSSPFVDVFDLRSFVFQNIQVDSTNPDAGLYVKIEFTEFHDYDLGLFHSDGTEAASSGESQPEPGLGAGSPEGAWEGGSNYEFLKGIRTTDCAGYTARVAGYLTTGGPVTISMWLGDVVADPAAPGGGETAMEMFYRALGL